MNGVPLPTLRHEVDRLFDFLVHSTLGTKPDGGAWMPAADVCETTDFYRIELDLPGIRHADLAIEARDRTLSVRGVRHPREPAPTAKSCLTERPGGAFSRSFRLPEDADARAVRARLEEGVLTIEIPRMGSQHRRTE